MSNNFAKIGFIKSFAKKSDRVTVYFPDGSTSNFTAQHDLTSSEVVVVGDRAFSNDVSRLILSRTTELFKSSQNVTDEITFPWAYLFSIDDYEAFEDATGRQIQYTDSSWSIDYLEGHLKVFGDGGGDFKTFEELSAFVEGYNYPEYISYYLTPLVQHYNIINIFSRFDQYTGINPNISINPAAITDGVEVSPMPYVYGANEARSSAEHIQRPIFPDRQYWILEEIIQDEIKVFYTTNPSNNSTEETYTITVALYPDSAEMQRAAYKFEGNLAYYQVNRDGSTEEGYLYNGAFAGNSEWGNLKRVELINLLSARSQIELPMFPELQLHNRIVSGKALLSGELIQEYSKGNIPKKISTSQGEMVFTDQDGNINGNIYQARIFLIPIKPDRDRNSGVKNIYVQVGNNRKVLLHTIPSFEAWDGYLSPIENNKIEVVLRCAKKFPKDRSLSNWRIEAGQSPGKSKYDREWAQTRVIHLNKTSGTVVQEQIYNNSETDLNPSSVADNIALDPSNWQKSWLETYSDWRSPNKFQFGELIRNFVAFQQRSGSVDDLMTGCRTILSELLSGTRKGVPNTSVMRELIKSTGYGTFTSNQNMVYLDPTNLFDRNVELDYSYSFGTLFFPSRNYAVFSGLANNSVTKSSYYVANPAYAEDNFQIGDVTEKPTLFPKLDLADEYAAGLNLPNAITRSEWNTEWSTEPGIQTDLLRFGIKAVAFLGN